MTICWKTEKLFSQKIARNVQKLNIFSLKIHRGSGIFPNKSTKHQKNDMEGLNSKNKNKNILSVADPLKSKKHFFSNW